MPDSFKWEVVKHIPFPKRLGKPEEFVWLARQIVENPISMVLPLSWTVQQVGKPGLDGHDRGAKVIVRALCDAGKEVIYSGLHQTQGQLVEAAIQEDVDLVGVSVLSGAHMTFFRELKSF